ncbi:MAG: 16S rRNA (adenine(1518)-N(6)/adenine(1519)-N(6))-dimethyltransferase RsmA [Coriobacteriia bacterium]|nr:16S rRNA (adenine(1518)-N(6)/adenine(1519)-N(6))-dimethyltransferase RsmA [Coriobacteriia bacterium]
MPHSRLASPSATIAVLKRHGLYTRKSLGQHFLVDDNIVGRIVEVAGIEPGEPVLEIGPGIGTLTDALLGAGATVVAVEYDRRLLPVLEELDAGPALTVVNADAVSVPISALTTPAGVPRALVANLPYAVAATVVLRLFEEMPSLDRAIVMVQAEVADRMSAVPGTKEYGSYTVKLALRARVSARFPVPRSCFLPPPRVDSAVIRLDRAESPAAGPAVVVAAARAADAAFTQRRKTLRNSLAAGLGVPVAEADALLASAGIDGSVRAETLDRAAYLALGAVLQAASGRS